MQEKITVRETTNTEIAYLCRTVAAYAKMRGKHGEVVDTDVVDRLRESASSRIVRAALNKTSEGVLLRLAGHVFVGTSTSLVSTSLEAPECSDAFSEKIIESVRHASIQMDQIIQLRSTISIYLDRLVRDVAKRYAKAAREQRQVDGGWLPQRMEFAVNDITGLICQ